MINEYYFKKIEGTTLESRFRFRGTSLLVFAEWLDNVGKLNKKTYSHLGTLLRTSMRCVYPPKVKKVSVIVTATHQEEYYDTKTEKIKTGSMFEPIGQHLRSEYQIVDIPYNYDVLKAKNNYSVLESYLSQSSRPDIIARLIQSLNTMKEEWKKIKRKLPPKIVHKIDIYLECFALKDMIDITCYINMFKIRKPKVYITFDSFSPYGMRGTVAAKYSDCKAIGIQHGLFTKHPERLKSKEEAKIFPYPDLFLAWGEASKKRLIEETGFSRKNIKVIGSARYDYLYYKWNTFDERFNSTLWRIFRFDKSGVDDPRRILVVTEGPISRELPYIVEKVINKLNIKNLGMIIKLHRGEKNIYRNLESKNVSISRKYLYEFLLFSDVMVTINSSTILEASVYECPYITFGSEGPDKTFSAKECHAKNENELAEFIKKIIFDTSFKERIIKKQKKIFKKQCHKFDGKTSQRIARIIENVEI